MEGMVNLLDQLKEVYQGKKVFLTGHTGFKGAWLLKTLSNLGAIVKGYALEPQTKNDLYFLVEGDNFCESIIADIRNRKRLITEITNFQPDFVFHLAAQPLVRLSYQIPSDTFEINAIGTANLLDGVRNLKTKCTVVIITTDKVYHNNEWAHPYRESDMLGGYDPYSASKACAELVVDSYRNSFFNTENFERHYKSIAVARAGNVIGGGDWSQDRLVPDIIRALQNDEDVVLRNPHAVRPWQHVLDPVFGYLTLGAKLEASPLKFSQAYNFGPNTGDTLSVEDMVKQVISICKRGNYIVETNPSDPHEAGLLKLDISKAMSELEWCPNKDSTKSIIDTVSWYEAFNRGENMNVYTENEIYSFIK